MLAWGEISCPRLQQLASALKQDLENNQAGCLSHNLIDNMMSLGGGTRANHMWRDLLQKTKGIDRFLPSPKSFLIPLKFGVETIQDHTPIKREVYEEACTKIPNS